MAFHLNTHQLAKIKSLREDITFMEAQLNLQYLTLTDKFDDIRAYQVESLTNWIQNKFDSEDLFSPSMHADLQMSEKVKFVFQLMNVKEKLPMVVQRRIDFVRTGQ